MGSLGHPLNTVGASLSCGPTSVLGTFLAFSQFPVTPILGRGNWPVSILQVSTRRPREVRVLTQPGRDSAGFEFGLLPPAASVLIPECYIT